MGTAGGRGSELGVTNKLVFTDRHIKALRSTGERIELTDITCRGLTIRVTPNQVKTWSLSVRRGGERYRVTLGQYPDVPLTEARSKADKARASIAEGRTTKASKRKADRPKNYEALVTSFLEDIKAQKIHAHYVNCLKRPRAEFGRLDPDKIDREDIKDFIKALAKNHPVMANRTQAAICRVFNWAVDEKYARVNPILHMKRTAKEESRERTLDSDEIKTFWTKIDEDGSPVSPLVGLSLKLVLISAQRPGEISGLRHDELIDKVGPQPIAEIPGERMKAGKKHSWPITATAANLIESAFAMQSASRVKSTKAKSQFIFPARREREAGAERGDKPITRNALSHALRRFCAHFGLKPFTAHDLRRTANSIASAEGILMEHSERLLAHKLPGQQAVL